MGRFPQGGGGSGTITEIESTDSSVTITDPTGPIVDLTGAGGGGGAVSSVFHRTGAVVAVSGDYTADQVGAPNVFNVLAYGADPTGATDSTTAITNAYNAAVAAGGGIVYLPEGIYQINNASGLSWASGTVALIGAGYDASSLRAGSSCTSQVLAVTNPKRGLFQDFKVDANGIATNAIVQSVATETSVGTRWVRVEATGATGTGTVTVGSSYPGFQWVNLKCEDNTYLDCYTGGNEGSPNSVPRCFAIYMPAGAAKIIGGELFGRHDIVAQQITYVGGTYGPLWVETNPTYAYADCSLVLIGCYIYDGGVDHATNSKAIYGPNGLYAISALGCWFVQQVATTFIQGNVAAGVAISLKDCTYFQGAATGTTIQIMEYSGSGSVNIEGGSVLLNNATTINLASGTGPTLYNYIKTANVTNTNGAVTFLQAGNNLSDLASSSTARTNLGLGSIATLTSAASGDLSGTWPSPVVSQINGTALGTLSGATAGQVLQWNGTAWVPAAAGGIGVTVSGTPSGANQVLTSTSSSTANWQTPAINSSSAIQLSLTETVLYPPTTDLRGNTAFLVVQNETFGFLPPLVATTSAIVASGSTWTLNFASSILGTLGQVGDTFTVTLANFTPSGYNGTYTATVASSTSATITNAATPGNVTVWGSASALPAQYHSDPTAGGGAPPAVLQINGTNTLNQSVSALYGLGPMIQNFLETVNGTPYSVSVSCTNGSNSYVVSGDHRATLPVGLLIGGNAGVPATAQVNQVYYDGTNTTIIAYNAATFTPSNFTGTTGSYTLTFTPFIADPEQVVMAPTITTTPGAVTSFPINVSTFAAPGQGQGWHLGYWDGPIYQPAGGGSISNINVANYLAYTFMGAGASGLQRIAYLAGDVIGAPASFANNFGLMIGQLQPNASTLYPLVGGSANYGLVNASSTAYPSPPPFTTVTSGPAPPSITGITSTSSTFTVTFSSAHGLSAGNTFTLSGFTPSGYNGTWTVASAIGTTGTGGTYTVTVNSTAALGAGSGGTAAYLTGYLLENAGTPTLTVASTQGFNQTSSAGGSLNITQGQGLFPVVVTYTGITGTTFTGCAVTSGAANNIETGGAGLVWGGNAVYYITGSPVLPVPRSTVQDLATYGGAATPTLSAGAYDGQEIVYMNVGSSTITFARSAATGNNLYLTSASLALGNGSSLRLIWKAALSGWVQIGSATGLAN